MGDVVKMKKSGGPAVPLSIVLMTMLFDNTEVGKALNVAEYNRCRDAVDAVLDECARRTKNDIVAWMKNSPELTNIIQDDFREKTQKAALRAIAWILGLKRRELWAWKGKKGRAKLSPMLMAIIMEGTELPPAAPVAKAAEAVPGDDEVITMDAAPVEGEILPSLAEEKSPEEPTEGSMPALKTVMVEEKQ